MTDHFRGGDTHITGHVMGSLGHLVSRGNHSGEAALALLLFIILSIGMLKELKMFSITMCNDVTT